MTERDEQQQKYQAQLDEWKREIESLKAKAATAMTAAQESLAAAQQAIDRQAAMTKEIEVLEGQIDDAEAKLVELAEADEDTWESIKEGVESAWESLKSAVGNTVGKARE